MSGLRGAEQLEEALAPIGKVLEDPVPILRLVGELGVRACQRNIDRGTDPDGVPYPATARGGTILRDTGVLYNGITYELQGRGLLVGAGAVSSAYNAYQHFGSALWHEGQLWEKGRKAGRQKGNPPRAFIGISDEDLDEILEEIGDYMEEAIR